MNDCAGTEAYPSCHFDVRRNLSGIISADPSCVGMTALVSSKMYSIGKQVTTAESVMSTAGDISTQ